MKNITSIEQKVLKLIKSESLLEKGDKIIIALSGGPDSTFLLHLLKKYQKKYNLTISAFHLNHKLRGKASDDDEKFCKAICDELGVEIHIYRKDIKAVAKKNKVSVEEAGRDARYSILNNLTKKLQYNKIATAHIRDDNTETVLLNIIKGTGVSGVSGIPIKRDNIVRPLLTLSKEEILFYLKSEKIEFVNDESNQSEDFERNFVRLSLVPNIKSKLNPNLDETLFNSSQIFKYIKNYIDEEVRNVIQKSVIKNDVDVEIKIAEILKHKSAIVSELFRSVILKKWKISTSYDEINRLIGLLNQQSGKEANLSGNLIARKERDFLRIFLKASDLPSSIVSIKIGEKIKNYYGTLAIELSSEMPSRSNQNKNIEFISGDNIESEFILRNWEKGDRFYPLGMTGSKKISDYFVDSKINISEKNEIQILENKKRIVWVVGNRINDRFKITNKTKKVVKLCWIPKKKS